jgi:SAM-dependent methyltransferase
MVYLTRKQIESILQKIGQPQASVVLRNFFYSYRKKLNSSDVKDLYDDDYLYLLDEAHRKFRANGKIELSVYNKPAYDYISKNIKSHHNILDIGCGTGEFVLAMGYLGANKAVGIDFSARAIEASNQKLSLTELSNCSYSCKDVSELISNDVFNYVVLNDVTEHLSDSELAVLFEGIKKVISADGEVVIHTPNGTALCYDTDRSALQELRKFYLRLKGWKGFEWSVDQLFYYQEHINVKGFKNLNKLLTSCGFKSRVIYDDSYPIRPLSYIISSNMLVIAKKQ